MPTYKKGIKKEIFRYLYKMPYYQHGLWLPHRNSQYMKALGFFMTTKCSGGKKNYTAIAYALLTFGSRVELRDLWDFTPRALTKMLKGELECYIRKATSEQGFH